MSVFANPREPEIHCGDIGCETSESIHYIPAHEFEDFAYTPEELNLVQDLIAQVAEPRKSARDESPVGNMLAAALPPLTPDEERTLFRRMNYTRFQADAIRASLANSRRSKKKLAKMEALLIEADSVRRRLAESYIRLVVSVARKFATEVHDFQELVSDGMLILLAAIDKFDYSRGFRFSTYLTHSIQRFYYRRAQRCQRFDERFTSMPGEMLVDMAQSLPEEYVETEPQDAFQQLMQAAEGCLEEREQSILQRRFGLGGEAKTQTLREIAAEFGMSKERVRQIQARAMTKLKRIATGLNLAVSVN